MSSLKFEWDENKEATNLEKHGIGFKEASSVFSDENAKLIFDPEHSISEDRFVIMGISSYLRILVVCHCYRKDEEIIRIISARKAKKTETKHYGV